MTLLDQDRLTREQKLTQESGPLAEGHEVRFAERHFLPRHAMGIEEIRDRVDALEVRRRLTPEAPLPPPPPPPAPAPRIREDLRAALAPLVQGELVGVEVVYRAGRGDVVEATVESEGARQRRLFVVTDGEARPADDIESRIDALPAPAAPEAPSPSASPSPSPSGAQPEPEAKKNRFAFGRKKEAAPATPPETTPAPEAKPEEPSKRRFGFGRKADAEKEPAPADEKPAKKRFGFGKR